jgi:regulator of sigma E protease
MGPKLFSFKGKNGDETIYSIRLLPIGGYVQMAGEEVELDKNIPDENRMQSKSFIQRFLIMIAGALNNFILGIVIIFIMAMIYGSYTNKPYIDNVEKNSTAYNIIEKGDLITKVNNVKVNTIDDVLLQFQLVDSGESINLTVKNDAETKSVKVKPVLEKDTYVYGISLANTKVHGFKNAISYTFSEFASVFKSMYIVIVNLITGNLGVDSLAGPVGIYNAIGEQAKYGFENVMYIAGFITINVGFVNLLPFPALDGGRILFLIIEKIRKKAINIKVENIVNLIGFSLLMVLVVFITIKDVIKLF